MTGRFYVYFHIDPKTKERVYIGKGSYGRAWDVTRSKNYNPEHQQWMIDLCEEGFIPSDWVIIYKQNLSEKQARRLETELIHEGLTQFNRQSGERQHQSKLTNDQAIDIFIRSRSGENPVDLAGEFKISKAAVYMIKNRKQWKSITAGAEIET